MKKALSAAVLFLVAIAYAGQVHAQSAPNVAVIEQELANLKAQLVDLEIQAGMIPFQGAPTEQLGGDFAGGITPSNLWTGSAATNSVSPNLSSVLVPGAISAGGTSANSQLAAIYTAVVTWPWTPSSTSAVTIASGTTNTTSTMVSFSAAGFTIGDPCEVQFSGTTSTLFTQAFVTAVNGSAVTSTVTFLNSTLASITMTVTSTVTGVTSTLKTTCFATGV